MPRYSSTQAFSDTSSNVRTIPYEQAKGGDTSAPKAAGVVKPEKVVNPYGSCAGAGSGEFHVYRHARSREMERVKQLTKAEEEAKADEEFQRKLEQYKAEEQERTEKRRKKRQRAKEAKMRKKNLQQVGFQLTEEKKEVVEEEFSYTPIFKDGEEDKASVDGQAATAGKEKQDDEVIKQPPFANDGSFLEMMKKQLEDQSKKSDDDDDDEGPPLPPSKKAKAEQDDGDDSSSDEEGPQLPP